jgi:hypothetical protein
MRRLLALLPLALIASLSPASALAAEPGVHSDNMSYVKNIPYPAKNGGTASYGTDIEFATLAGRQYALAGSYKNGMQIVDISDPQNARTAATYDGGVTQGDVQIFRQASKPGRTFAGYASDTFGDGTSTCYGNDIARGLDVYKFSNARARSQRPGRWMSPAAARAALAGRPRVAVSGATAFFCLLA